jgi:hypothetical protein
VAIFCHYSDFVRLLSHNEAEGFLADKETCERVAAWKAKVFPSDWARYDLAKHGTFRLAPETGRLKELEKDYEEMRPMFLSQPISFKQLMARLREAEEKINIL